ncbi:hypothetical protein AXG93_1148s1000 [Marchantia polymorpha subsp. ruderalis]|uniref:Uncharacterized protein n=1 Tax=Marchantia polymorpha subsp. ruderalis TaxID=1480154 RepID=A0A176W0Y4_MARPO|nr:hypothetical protein AXG93_1148s1000 [Marchantia polymorpha subsp. ruderalis]
MHAQKRCLHSEQVSFDDTPSEQGQFRVLPLALRPLESIPTGEGRDAETCVPSAEGANRLASAEPEWEDVAGPRGAGSSTPLEVLARHEVEAVAEEAGRPSARESPRIAVAKEILESEEDTPLEEEEVQLVRGTPTRVLCEQVVPLLRYLDRKVSKETAVAVRRIEGAAGGSGVTIGKGGRPQSARDRSHAAGISFAS